jgi:hypothetical protein
LGYVIPAQAGMTSNPVLSPDIALRADYKYQNRIPAQALTQAAPGLTGNDQENSHDSS